MTLDLADLRRVVDTALAEDLRYGPDVTAAACVPAAAVGTAVLVPRRCGVLAGLPAALAVFDAVLGADGYQMLETRADGARLVAGEVVLRLRAPLRGLLTAERTALNLVCHLSGVATATAAWVAAVAGTGTRIRDSRKTLPGLRLLEKYAVRCGGGVNHRFGLGDAVLVKDNHVVAAGSVTAALAAARAASPRLPCEVEVDSLAQLDEALAAGAALVLLDNFDVPTTAEAVRRAAGTGTELESSGGLTLAVARTYAATGVHYLAVGALTHSAPALDLGLDLLAPPARRDHGLFGASRSSGAPKPMIVDRGQSGQRRPVHGYADGMLRRIDLRDGLPALAALRGLLPRAEIDVDAVLDQVRPVVDAVRERGVPAVLELAERFDRVRPTSIRVPAVDLRRALDELDPAVRDALEESIARARRVHADQRRRDVTTQVAEGGTVTERWVPVARVGLYAPGGLAVYPSSVVMNVVPAQAAEVAQLVVCSPPQAECDGQPHPLVLAAAALLGVEEVWAVGGAQAVALLAYGGTDTDGAELAPVDLVTGPGNVYVTAAKRLLRGLVGIDSEAGPTEIAILADHTADPLHVAADLISQAEHDTLAASVLVTTSEELATAVDDALAAQVATTKHTERISAALAGRQSATVLVSDVDDGLAVVDAYAAEHLEIQTVDPREVALRVRNAGAIFVGPWAAVSLGDYCAGSNHVLPTGGCARHSSGLSVQTFLRGIHIVDYTEQALREVADRVVALAVAEDLPAHGQAVAVRFGAREDA